MKIDQLTLENFRCFSHKTFTFSPQFNILAGDNGSGKTALLEALAIGAGAFLLGIDDHPARLIHSEDARRVYSQNANLPLREFKYPVKVSVEGVVGGKSLSWYRSRNSVDGKTTTLGAKNMKKVATNLQAQVRDLKPVELPLIAYYGTDRMWHQKLRSVIKSNNSSNGSRVDIEIRTVAPGSRMEGYRKCLNADTNQSFLDLWLKTREISLLQRQTPNEALEGVKQAVARCMDRWTKLTYDIGLDELLVEDIQGNRMPTRLLSDGQRNILYMALDIACRAVTLNPHFDAHACLKTEGVVLIDEIDLHLHPRWQRRVVDDLRAVFPKIQFIATTHAPSIIQSLRAGELIDLNEGEPGEYVGRSPEDILEQIMDVELPQRSRRSLEMIKAAEEFYQVLQEAKNAHKERLEELKQHLDELTEPFADNEAYIAFLRSERIAAGIGAKAEA